MNQQLYRITAGARSRSTPEILFLSVCRTHVLSVGDGDAALLIEVGGPVQRRVLVERLAAAGGTGLGYSSSPGSRSPRRVRLRVAYCVTGRGGTAAAEEESSLAGSLSSPSSSCRAESGAGSMDAGRKAGGGVTVVLARVGREYGGKEGDGRRRNETKWSEYTLMKALMLQQSLRFSGAEACMSASAVSWRLASAVGLRPEPEWSRTTCQQQGRPWISILYPVRCAV
jgi:hypothetical protein